MIPAAIQQILDEDNYELYSELFTQEEWPISDETLAQHNCVRILSNILYVDWNKVLNNAAKYGCTETFLLAIEQGSVLIPSYIIMLNDYDVFRKYVLDGIIEIDGYYKYILTNCSKQIIDSIELTNEYYEYLNMLAYGTVAQQMELINFTTLKLLLSLLPIDNLLAMVSTYIIDTVEILTYDSHPTLDVKIYKMVDNISPNIDYVTDHFNELALSACIGCNKKLAEFLFSKGCYIVNYHIQTIFELPTDILLYVLPRMHIDDDILIENFKYANTVENIRCCEKLLDDANIIMNMADVFAHHCIHDNYQCAAYIQKNYNFDILSVPVGIRCVNLM